MQSLYRPTRNFNSANRWGPDPNVKAFLNKTNNSITTPFNCIFTAFVLFYFFAMASMPLRNRSEITTFFVVPLKIFYRISIPFTFFINFLFLPIIYFVWAFSFLWLGAFFGGFSFFFFCFGTVFVLPYIIMTLNKCNKCTTSNDHKL